MIEKDVVIMGAGGAGLAAAVVAAHRGLDVLVVEKTAELGGATAWSGGNVWAPCNTLAARAGIVDSREAASQYLRAVVQSGIDQPLMDAFLATAPAMVDFFQQHTAVQFELQPLFGDHHPDAPGALAGGRCVTPLPYDGRELGEWFQHLKGPLEQVNAPFGMMIGFGDIQHFTNMTQSLVSFWYVVKMAARLVRDKVLYGRGTRLTMGNALAARLVRSALDKGVTLWRQAPVVALLREGSRVSGVVVEYQGERREIRARRGVLLASGGFSGSDAMRHQHIPYPNQHVSLMPEGNSGDGIAMALSLDGQLAAGNTHNGDWVVASQLRNPDGSVTNGLHTVLDRPKPGCIAVNSLGRRFCNEADNAMAAAMHSADAVPAYLLCDNAFIRKNGLGLIRPGGFGLDKFRAAGYLTSADTVEELASRLAMPAGQLSATVKRFNGFAERGVDEDFGRGDSPQDRAKGDAAHQPNPCLGPLATPPFHAVKILPGDASTWLGLQVDGSARVLDGSGQPIPGLYAAGLDVNSLWKGHPPSLGANNTLSLTLGYIAATAMADHNP